MGGAEGFDTDPRPTALPDPTSERSLAAQRPDVPGGKYLTASQEENVCDYLGVLLVNSGSEPASPSESYLIFSLFRAKDRLLQPPQKIN